MSILSQGVLILDYGSQYTLLIARRIRELGVYSEVWPCNDTRVNAFIASGEAPARGVILSGGPSSVSVEGAPTLAGGLLDLDVPVLGICYGMQLLADAAGATVSPSTSREYGRAMIEVDAAVGLFEGFEVGESTQVWMSHGDSVGGLPEGYEVVARTENGVLAAIANVEERRYGVQFHPEVAHTPRGADMLGAFLRGPCGCGDDWRLTDFLDRSVQEIQARVGPDERVICGLSGGVDSSVVAAMLHRALGERLTCVFVDNGLCRQGEAEQVRDIFEDHFGVDLRVVDAQDQFLDALAGVTDPELKRKRIGGVFIDVFKQVAAEIEGAKYLAQGTLYPLSLIHI